MSSPISSVDQQAAQASGAARLGSAIDAYWQRNLRIMAALLAVWALAGLGCGILLADTLNAYEVGGIPMGFWFAQQGSILIFVGLILAYCLLMNRLDASHHTEMERIRKELSAAPSAQVGTAPGGQAGTASGGQAGTASGGQAGTASGAKEKAAR